MSPHLPAVTSDEFIRVIRKLGFELARQSGTSHAIFKRPSDNRRTNISMHSGHTISRKTFKSILADVGVTVEEFAELR